LAIEISPELTDPKELDLDTFRENVRQHERSPSRQAMRGLIAAEGHQRVTKPNF
jgi:hypothetical protein